MVVGKDKNILVLILLVKYTYKQHLHFVKYMDKDRGEQNNFPPTIPFSDSYVYTYSELPSSLELTNSGSLST